MSEVADTPATGRAPLARPLAIYVVLALLLCAPALPHPTFLALGDPATDTWNHLWGYQHVARAVAEGRSLLAAPGLRYPEGGTLWFIDTFGALLLAPVTLLAGPVLAMNLYVALNLVFAGLMAHLLARDVSRDDGAATLAGAAFLTTPHLLAQVYNGISETLAVGWLPLLLLCLRRLGRAPTVRQGVAAGLVAGCAAMANAYYGIFAVGLGVCWLGGLAWAAPRRAWACRGPLLAGGVAGLLAVLPFAAGLRASLGAQDAVVTREGDFTWASLVGHNQTDLLALVHPGDWYSPDLLVRFDDALIVVVYVGWTLLVLGALALGRDPHRARPWALGAAVAMVLALGPLLYLNGQYVRLGEAWVPLPFLALYDLVPGLGRVSHPFRLAVLVGMAASVLASLAVVGRPRVAYLLAGVVVAEAALFSPARMPMPVSDARVPAWAGTLPRGAVLDLPMSTPVLPRARYSWLALAHGNPIPWGLNDPLPDVLLGNRMVRWLVALERTSVDFAGPDLPVVDLEVARRALVLDGYRTVVLHPSLYPDNRARPAVTMLTALLGPPREAPDPVEGRVLVYDLGTP